MTPDILIRALAESCETAGSSLMSVILRTLFDAKASLTGYWISLVSGENGYVTVASKVFRFVRNCWCCQSASAQFYSIPRCNRQMLDATWA